MNVKRVYIEKQFPPQIRSKLQREPGVTQRGVLLTCYISDIYVGIYQVLIIIP